MKKKPLVFVLYKEEKEKMFRVRAKYNIAGEGFVNMAYKSFKKIIGRKSVFKPQFNDFEKVKTYHIQIAVDQELVKEINELAATNKITKGQMGREIICRFLEAEWAETKWIFIL